MRRIHAAGMTSTVALALFALLALVAAACGSDAGARTADASGADADAGQLRVVASLYPLAYVVERIGGERVAVTNLTPAGAEPHDIELTPDDLKGLHDADLVVYLDGFSPAVDEAVAAEAGDRALAVGSFADLSLTYTPIDAGADAGDEQGVDPHFWLDPTRLAGVADEVGRRLAESDPDGAAELSANAAGLREDLEALDAALSAGLSGCVNRTIVTSHSAFAYLAERYDFTQVGVAGLTPEEEPTPADLAAAARFVEDHDVRTIYYETLVSPDVAETVAAETGAPTAVLDPIEGLQHDAAGADYLSIMRANLASLRAGQPCP